jgi:hypothetical protein
MLTSVFQLLLTEANVDVSKQQLLVVADVYISFQLLLTEANVEISVYFSY